MISEIARLAEGISGGFTFRDIDVGSIPTLGTI